MSYDNLSSVSQNGLKFYQQLTGEERRIPFIFDDFHIINIQTHLVGFTTTYEISVVLLWAVLTKIYPPLPTSVQPISITKTLLIVLTKNERDHPLFTGKLLGLDMTENRIFTLCRMITWVVFLRMFWNFISSLPVKRGWSLSFLVGTISNFSVMEIGWTDVGSGGYILVSCAHNNRNTFLLKLSYDIG
jgi:hypothetical protein